MAIGACIGQFFLIILGPDMINGWLMYTLEWQEVQEIESILYGNYPSLFLDMSSVESYERAHLLEDEINLLILNSGIKNKCSTISTS